MMKSKLTAILLTLLLVACKPAITQEQLQASAIAYLTASAPTSTPVSTETITPSPTQTLTYIDWLAEQVYLEQVSPAVKAWQDLFTKDFVQKLDELIANPALSTNPAWKDEMLAILAGLIEKSVEFSSVEPVPPRFVELNSKLKALAAETQMMAFNYAEGLAGDAVKASFVPQNAENIINYMSDILAITKELAPSE